MGHLGRERRVERNVSFGGRVEMFKVNWIMPRPGLAGGVKSNRLIAEAFARRGHRVTIYYPLRVAPDSFTLHPRSIARRLKARLTRKLKPPVTAHHLEHSDVELVGVDDTVVRSNHVHDADLTIATMWKTREWIEDWPTTKGVKGYFVRHDERVFGETPDRVAATYRMGGPKFAIAQWLQRMLIDEFGNHRDSVTLIPNGIDRKQFSISEANGLNRPCEAVVGFCYSRWRWKGSETALSALRSAQREMPALKVISFSENTPRISDRLPRNFELRVAPPQAEIPAIYAASQLWLMPSVLEGFGMPGVEAMACWRPVVATACGGADDYIHEGTDGWLVPVGDAKAMAAHILRVLRLPDVEWQALSRAAHATSQVFDWDASAVLLERAIVESTRGKGTS
jgi:glycosyltransferase involved in cell wall biosynthesis